MASSDSDDPRPPCSHAQSDVGTTDDSLAHMVEDGARFGDIYRVQTPGRRSDTWVVADPEAIKRVLVSNHRNYTIGRGLDRVRLLVGDGIIVSEGEVWKRQHRMMQPMFQRTQIERFGPMIAAVTQRRLAQWSGSTGADSAFNITKETSESALEVVLRATFGTDFDRLLQDADGNPFAMLSEETNRDLRFAYRFRQLSKHIQQVINWRESPTAVGDDSGIDWLA